MLKPLLLAAAALTFAAVPGAAVAAGPQPPNCPLYSTPQSIERPLTLPGGEHLVARDPYGGLLARNRLFFSFGVQRQGGGKVTGVAQVTWALDGKVVRTDPTAPFQWAGLSGSKKRMPAGDHVITVTVTPSGGGAPVITSFPLTATDCQPASTFSEIEEASGGGSRPLRGSRLYATSSYESQAGPTLGAVVFRSADVFVRIAQAARGRVAGTVSYGPGNSAKLTSRTLRVPRSGSTLLSRGGFRVALHPGAKGFLTVHGLPATTREVTVTLTAAGGRDLLAARRIGKNRCRYRMAAEITGIADGCGDGRSDGTFHRLRSSGA